MIVEQIYTGCLSQGAYYIESNGEAAIIDPLRETAPYMAKAEAQKSKIKYIFETHFHADFVSGHLDLAKKTGAKIIYGPGAQTSYQKHEAVDGEVFKLGNVTIEVLHTPGHTPESSCYLLRDEDSKAHALFSGDTLFIGDVGRPDLAQKGDLTKEDLAGMLFESLRNRVMTLPDHVIVYPAHGAGSACGKKMSSETFDTLGNQRATNYALRADMSKEEFIAEVTDGIQPPPQYFAKNAAINKLGYQSYEEVLAKGAIGLDPKLFEEVANAENALILDTRTAAQFQAGHIPNSIFIGIDGSFAPWVGTLVVDIKQPILIVAEVGREEEVIKRLARVGYDHALGFLEGGFEAWAKASKPVENIDHISADELKAKLTDEANESSLQVIDVRKPAEFESSHYQNALNHPLDFINDQLGKVDREQTYHIHCRSGYRSMVFISILKARGFKKLVDINGGILAMEASQLPLVSTACTNS